MLNGGPNVRPEMRERVQKAVALLGYQVNVQARHLAGGGPVQVTLIHASDLDSEPNSYYHSGLELGALRACADRGFELVTHTVNQNASSSRQRILDQVTAGRIAGIVLTPPFADDVALIREIIAKQCPVVCVSAGPAVRAITASVGIDDEQAAFDLASELIAFGHRSFGYVKGISGHISAELRFDGFLRALDAAGLNAACVSVERGNFTFRSGIECTERLLANRPKATAIVCANDDMAAGALLTAHKLGLAIPGGISIVGFDDTPVSEIVWPPLTTVHQPLRTLGHRAIDLLAEAVGAGQKAIAPGFHEIPYQIVTRDSSGPPAID